LECRFGELPTGQKFADLGELQQHLLARQDQVARCS